MDRESRNEIRNLAIIAHVDHGKSTLVDQMLWQSGICRELGCAAEEVRRAIDQEREKRLAAMPRLTTIEYRDVRINVVDAPSRAGLGRELERTLCMVEGVLFLVDASEGPSPQTRFVLRKALEAGLAPLVVINKIDHPGARPEAVLQEVRDLFVDLDASDRQLEFPVLYCNAHRGLCRRAPSAADESLLPLFDELLRTVPAPRHAPGAALQLLVAQLDYDDFLGRLALGRVLNGRLRSGQQVVHCRLNGDAVPATVSGLYAQAGLRRVEADEVLAGDLALVTGVEALRIGESLCAPEDPRPLPPGQVDEPTVAVLLSVNDSPMAGLEGEFVDRERLRERLWRELLTNAAIRVEETESPHTFRLAGRSELQLAILLEMLRREGYEVQVGRPHVLTREIDGQRHEPMERLVIDCPEPFAAVVTEKVTPRKGRLTKMVNHGTGRVLMEFRIPSRGLFGFRSEFLSDTRGTGILNHLFDGYDAWQGEFGHRTTGVLVADRPGRATAHALEHLQPRGTMFIAPGTQVYEGMIVGENARPEDVDVNVTKERRPEFAGSSTSEPTTWLIPPRSMSLEHALEFIRDDELVEVTPRAFRLRKKTLESAFRRRKA